MMQLAMQYINDAIGHAVYSNDAIVHAVYSNDAIVHAVYSNDRKHKNKTCVVR